MDRVKKKEVGGETSRNEATCTATWIRYIVERKEKENETCPRWKIFKYSERKKKITK